MSYLYRLRPVCRTQLPQEILYVRFHRPDRGANRARDVAIRQAETDVLQHVGLTICKSFALMDATLVIAPVRQQCLDLVRDTRVICEAVSGNDPKRR